MSKVRGHRGGSPTIDMTPMVDLAFLLVTFFMLTTKFNEPDPVAIDTPTSVSVIKIPDTDVLTISIAKDGRVLFNMDGQYNRAELLNKMGAIYNVQFDKTESHSFALASSMGIPMGSLKQYLDMDVDQRKLVPQPGIPIDSLHNELADWILQARLTNRRLRIAIK